MSLKKLHSATLGVLLLVLTVQGAFGQRISFQAFAGADISITVPGGSILNFSKDRALTPNMEGIIKIGRVEQGPPVALEIQAAEGFDIMIDLTYETGVFLDGNTGAGEDGKIPLALSFAYSYVNNPANSIEVPPGIRSIIVPVSPRRSSGAPGPPPSPFSGDTNTRPKGTLYFFVYGDLGPIGNVQQGLYSSTIRIDVSYADYN